MLAPVAFVTHMDSLPMNALAALDTDEVGRGGSGGVCEWAAGDWTAVALGMGRECATLLLVLLHCRFSRCWASMNFCPAVKC